MKLVHAGDLSPEKHLKIVNEEVFSHFDKKSRDAGGAESTRIWPQQRWSKTKRIECQGRTTGVWFPGALTEDHPWKVLSIACSVGLSAEQSGMVAVGYLVDSETLLQRVTLNVVSSLLLNGPTAPFYKALIKTGLGRWGICSKMRRSAPISCYQVLITPLDLAFPRMGCLAHLRWDYKTCERKMWSSLSRFEFLCLSRVLVAYTTQLVYPGNSEHICRSCANWIWERARRSCPPSNWVRCKTCTHCTW